MNILDAIKRIVVDESVSTHELARFKLFGQKHSLDEKEYFLVKENHPGIPDSQILRHLLNERTILVTADRPFHNTVLAAGLKSYYISEREITDRHLRGVTTSAVTSIGRTVSLRESYHPPQTEIRQYLLLDSVQWLGKQSTKHRRIRNHFGGLDHIEEIAITVSWEPKGPETLIGVKIQASSNIGVKAITASESYTAERIEIGNRDISALSYGLVVAIQLMLNSIKTVVYFDQTRIKKTDFSTDTGVNLKCNNFFDSLVKSFDSLKFAPSQKGRHLDAMRMKLHQLLTTPNTNEIANGILAKVTEQFEKRMPGVSSLQIAED